MYVHYHIQHIQIIHINHNGAYNMPLKEAQQHNCVVMRTMKHAYMQDPHNKTNILTVLYQHLSEHNNAPVLPPMPPPPGKQVHVEAVDFAKDAACGCTCEGAPPGAGVVAAADEAASAGAGSGSGAGAASAACTSNEKLRMAITTPSPSPSPSCHYIPGAESQLVCSFSINAQLFSSR